MKQTSVLFRSIAVAAAVMFAASPAAAHEGAIGEGGPIVVRVDAGFGDYGDGRWGNGEFELHVEPGVEVIALGFESEPMAKVDADGNMFGNLNSVTWKMNQSPTMDMDMGMDIDMAAPATAPLPMDMNAGMDMGMAEGASDEPVWEWQRGGGSLQMHDHRIHFMAASIAPEIADGGDISKFAMPFLVDGEEFVVRGALVFTPALDPVRAAELVAAGAELTTSVETDSSSITSTDDMDMGDAGMGGDADNEMDMTQDAMPVSAANDGVAEAAGRVGVAAAEPDSGSNIMIIWSVLGGVAVLGLVAIAIKRRS